MSTLGAGAGAGRTAVSWLREASATLREAVTDPGVAGAEGRLGPICAGSQDPMVAGLGLADT